MKVYITKYALTQGIFERDDANFNGNVASVPDPAGTTYYHGMDWHRDKDAAIKRAENMLSAKVESLHRQISKLSNMAEDQKWPKIIQMGAKP